MSLEKFCHTLHPAGSLALSGVLSSIEVAACKRVLMVLYTDNCRAIDLDCSECVAVAVLRVGWAIGEMPGQFELPQRKAVT